MHKECQDIEVSKSARSYRSSSLPPLQSSKAAFFFLALRRLHIHDRSSETRFVCVTSRRMHTAQAAFGVIINLQDPKRSTDNPIKALRDLYRLPTDRRIKLRFQQVKYISYNVRDAPITCLKTKILLRILYNVSALRTYIYDES